jgi:hypothetical protein
MDQPLRFGSWRFTRSAHTRSGKRLLRRPLDQAQALVSSAEVGLSARFGKGLFTSRISNTGVL